MLSKGCSTQSARSGFEKLRFSYERNPGESDPFDLSLM